MTWRQYLLQPGWFLVSLLALLGCAHAAMWRADTTDAQTYYHFIRSCLEEYRHNDKAAVDNMVKAASLSDSSYYLRLETAKLMSRCDEQPAALREAKNAIALEPRRPEARLFYAWLLASERQWSEAEEAYLELLALEPDNAEALSSLAMVYTEEGRVEEAESTLKRLIKHQPNAESHYLLALFHGQNGQREDALADLKKALKKDPEHFESLRLMAAIQEDSGEWRQAAETLRKLIEIMPNPSPAKVKLVRLLLKNSRRAEAEEIMRELGVEADQVWLDPQTHVQLGLIYMEQGLFQEAAAEFEAVYVQEPGSGQAAYLLASALMELGEVERAGELLASVGEEDDVYVSSQLLLATTVKGSTVRDKLEKGLKVIEKALAKRPDSPRLSLARAIYFEEMGELKQARRAIEEAAEKFPHEAEVFFRLGVLEDKLDRPEYSIEAMKKAVSLNPRHAEALNYLAYSWAVRRENLSEALRLAQEADALSPDSGHILDTLGWVHYQLGDAQKALPLLEQALVLTEGDPVVHYHLGDVLMTLGRGQDALEQYRKALKANEKMPTLDKSFDQEDLNEKIRLLSR